MEFVAIWIVCGIIGSIIGNPKGLGCAGFVVGVLLGPLGVIIMVVLALVGDSREKRQCPFCKKMINREATVCPFCREKQQLRMCPFCKEMIHPEFTVCPNCQEEQPLTTCSSCDKMIHCEFTVCPFCKSEQLVSEYPQSSGKE
ncbi:MAG: zinc ribbon domain-containing protein [Candidatus Cloacimonetes bacterium]|nr:zinc ribbon domain-containing protein [Candidatus Cloacimonadota bacterium]